MAKKKRPVAVPNVRDRTGLRFYLIALEQAQFWLVQGARRWTPLLANRAARRNWPDLRLEFPKRLLEGLFGSPDKVDLDAFEHFGFEILLHVRLILRWKDDLANSGPLR